ncbi:FAD-dependent oxidoreductase [Bradyrhizobium sp. 186]|uniref:NAD(P)/FAD-dependent oxidoreductase n=1 Tax=Bradyrhizobium sp. 186 TaxID=2782654 RepID=UPI002000DA64|nr:FAD-dependent oxidoreductase [Bradyrhizobium sp. 186]UPK32679.1 FAD-dependent oxidoreductase [Bradyrhizobium sp. 186]
MNTSKTRVVIVGAGQAGGRAAEALRAAGHTGPITLIGEEVHLPYERPQLSKAILLDSEPNPAFIRNANGWAELDVKLSTSSRAVAADVNRREIGLKDGKTFAFDQLLLATGTRPRRMPELERGPLPVNYLRCMDDALALRSALQPGKNVVLVGGGVIGLEVASAAIARGCHVTVIEKAATVLPQVGSAVLSRYAETLHTAKGVCIRCGVSVKRATADGIELSDGTVVLADVILVGIGVEASVEIAQQLGLKGQQGIKVDTSGATGIDGVYAAGDVAEQWSPCHGRWMRLENWANAQNQAIATAKNMSGETTVYEAPPWFWTDQHGINIQIVGHPGAGEEIVRGDVAGGRFTTLSVRDGEVVGGIAANTARDMSVLRRLVVSRKRVSRDDLENPHFELKRSLVS